MGSMPSDGPRDGRLATIAGRVPTPAEMPAGCRFATRCPFVVAACRARAPRCASSRRPRRRLHARARWRTSRGAA